MPKNYLTLAWTDKHNEVLFTSKQIVLDMQKTYDMIEWIDEYLPIY